MTALAIEPTRIDPDAPFTVDDLLEFPDDGHRYELFNGSLLVSPAPSSIHQDVQFHLRMILHRARPAHLKVFSTINVRASDKDLYIPDLAIVPKAVVKTPRVMFAPDTVLLAVEIVSPSTKLRDRVLKKAAYAAAGIPVYWRIELDGDPIVHVHELNGSSYKEPTVYKPGTVMTVSSPYPISFDPAELIED